MSCQFSLAKRPKFTSKDVIMHLRNFIFFFSIAPHNANNPKNSSLNATYKASQKDEYEALTQAVYE